MSKFIEVTVDNQKMLINLEYITYIFKDEKILCRICCLDGHVDPDESYEQVRDLIIKSEKNERLEYSLKSRWTLLKKQYPQLPDNMKDQLCCKKFGYDCPECSEMDCEECWDLPVEE